jgi:transcriptional regulator of heat shock response
LLFWHFRQNDVDIVGWSHHYNKATIKNYFYDIIISKENMLDVTYTAVVKHPTSRRFNLKLHGCLVVLSSSNFLLFIFLLVEGQTAKAQAKIDTTMDNRPLQHLSNLPLEQPDHRRAFRLDLLAQHDITTKFPYVHQITFNNAEPAASKSFTPCFGIFSNTCGKSPSIPSIQPFS